MPIKMSWSDKEALMGLYSLSLPQKWGGTLNQTGNVRNNVTSRRIRITTVAVDKQ